MQLQVTKYLSKELTLRGIILGALITIVFTASNVYLGLKVGLTFASSIPAAVISMAVLKFFRDSNILENNMVQTQASAAGTLSAIIFVLPALLMMGYWNHFPFWQTTIICAAGGILGVIFTIPLRRVMVVNSKLPYPEGVAAAEILKAGDHQTDIESPTDLPITKQDSGIKYIISGSLIAALFSFFSSGLRILSDGAAYWFKVGNSIIQLPMGFSFALLGAGYLVGITGGIAMLIGVLFSWGGAVPYLSALAPLPAQTDIASYAISLWSSKVRYIGAGTIAVAAIWTLVTLCKPMWQGIKLSFQTLSHSSTQISNLDSHTERDLSAKTMLWIMLAVIVILMATFYHFVAPSGLSALAAWGLVLCATALAFVIGFMVAAACGYMAGLVGSSSSPISGIGIVAILIISSVFVLISHSSQVLTTLDGRNFLIALALFTTSVVVAIAAISNDNLQDLKTGYLIQATPARQQIALIIGCIIGAAVIAPVLALLYHAYGFVGALPRVDMDPTAALSAPQATLMTAIAQGIFSGNLQWSFILTGAVFGVLLIIIDVILKKSSRSWSLPPLAVGIGIYLPAAVTMPLFVGALITYFLQRHTRRQYSTAEAADRAVRALDRRGTLFAAGLIVGESLVGVFLAILIVISIQLGFGDAPLALNLSDHHVVSQLLGLVLFITGILFMVRTITRK